MKKKITVILILTLLITTTILPASGNVDFDKIELDEQLSVVEEEVTTNTISDVDWWPQLQHDPENIGYSTSTAPDTKNVLWSFTAKDEYSMYPSAVVVDGRVYTASVGVYMSVRQYKIWQRRGTKDNCSGKVFCLDAETGDVIWEYISRYGLHATPSVVDGKLYACSGLWGDFLLDDVVLYKKGDAFCLDAEDGSLIWEYLDCGYVEGGPAVIDEKMYFASLIHESDNGVVYCLNTSTGEKIWNRTMFKPRGPVAVSDSRVYIGIDVDDKDKTEKLFCLNALTGETIWSWNENNREEIIAAPTVVDGKVYVATSGYSYGTPDETVHVPGEVHCLDAENGDLLWESDINGRFYWCSPAVAYGNVYVGSGYSQNISLFGSFYCLNASDGSLVWKRPRICDILCLSGILPGCYSPAVADGKVYIGSTGRWTGNMHCLDAFTGKTIWAYRKFTLRFGSFFSPAIADGKVYAGFEGSIGHKAKLFCFGD